MSICTLNWVKNASTFNTFDCLQHIHSHCGTCQYAKRGKQYIVYRCIKRQICNRKCPLEKKSWIFSGISAVWSLNSWHLPTESCFSTCSQPSHFALHLNLLVCSTSVTINNIIKVPQRIGNFITYLIKHVYFYKYTARPEIQAEIWKTHSVHFQQNTQDYISQLILPNKALMGF